MAQLHATFTHPSSPSATTGPSVAERAEELLRLMHEEGVPQVMAKGGLFLAIVALVRQGEASEAARLACKGAECARVALGDDSAVYLKFDQLANAISSSGGDAAPGAGRAGPGGKAAKLPKEKHEGQGAHDHEGGAESRRDVRRAESKDVRRKR
jgi:hypothetical protein